ncbi:unnamed protein product [Adineta steineri]|uniref:Uncharacterized protein n=2 Tax=Adineta steineri TaxID=433720 RepID=A0A814G6I7_9BILA|nr:unnamed protein product [Adineta steineri]
MSIVILIFTAITFFLQSYPANGSCNGGSINSLECGGKCYNRLLYSCIGGILCNGTNVIICQGKCYDRRVYTCIGDQLCNGSNADICAGKCYNRDY